MTVQCLDLVDFLLTAEAITGIEAETLARLPRIQLVDSALSAPNSGIGETFYYHTFEEKAAAMTFRLIKNHPLIDGNKRVGYALLLKFVRHNGVEWSHPDTDAETGGDETVRVIVGVANGTISQEELADWIRLRVVEPEAADEG